MKIGDLVKALPLAKWGISAADNTYLGIVTKLGVDHEGLRGFPDKIVLLNFGDDDGIFRTSDWKFEVISENR